MKKRAWLAAALAVGMLISAPALAAEEAPPAPPAGAQTPEGQPPELPDGQTPPAMPDGQTPLEMPDGQTPPEMPDGQTPPELPNGQQPEMPDGQTPPEAPDGQPPQAPGGALPFADVAEGAWYRDAVAAMYGMGLLRGTSETAFSPDGTLDAAQVLTILYRHSGGAESGESWYAPALAWAVENGVADQALAAQPEAAISREAMMTVLYRYLALQGRTPEGTADLSAFADGDQVSDQAAEAVRALVGAGIVQGDGAALRPGDTLTRAEAAALLSRALLPRSGPEAAGGSGGPGAPDGAGGPGGGQVSQGTAAVTLTEDGTWQGESYRSKGADENALRVDGAAVTLEGVTVEKAGGDSSSTENGDFYGQNAALLATGGADLTLLGGEVRSQAKNGNGVFSYGQGTTVTLSGTAITTRGDNSGGLQTTGGGATRAENVTVETFGNSSAAIRSDRGGGTVEATGGSYTSNGYNSPAIYSTADITVRDAALTATNSEALVVEGKNAITLENCAVQGAMSATGGSSSSENVHTVMLYQSMSGDADAGTARLTVTGGSLTGQRGDLIYVTNTQAEVTLSGVALQNLDPEGVLLRAVGNSASHGWGQAGENGAQVTLTADGQTLEGDMVVDAISSLDLRLTGGSTWTGRVRAVENAQGGQSDQSAVAVTVEEGSVWTLTGDCQVTSLVNRGTIRFNGWTITLPDGTVLQD